MVIHSVTKQTTVFKDHGIICLTDSFKKWFEKINQRMKQMTGFLSEIINHSFNWFVQKWSFIQEWNKWQS